VSTLVYTRFPICKQLFTLGNNPTTSTLSHRWHYRHPYPALLTCSHTVTVYPVQRCAVCDTRNAVQRQHPEKSKGHRLPHATGDRRAWSLTTHKKFL